jgi:hypothetical protein
MNTDDSRAVCVGTRSDASPIEESCSRDAVPLPASMMLLGDWNWYLPKWLEWLPRLDVGETVVRPEPPKAPPRARADELERSGRRL